MTVSLKLFSGFYRICIGLYLCVNIFTAQCSIAGVSEEHKKMYLDFQVLLSIFPYEADKQIMKVEIKRQDDVYIGKESKCYGDYISDIEAAKEEGGSKELLKEKQKTIEQKYNIWKCNQTFISRFIELGEEFKYKINDCGWIRGEKPIDMAPFRSMANLILKSVMENNTVWNISFDNISDEEVLSVLTFAGNEMQKALNDSNLDNYGIEIEPLEGYGNSSLRFAFDGVGYLPNESACTIVDI